MEDKVEIEDIDDVIVRETEIPATESSSLTVPLEYTENKEPVKKENKTNELFF